jgi:hypothetical protein
MSTWQIFRWPLAVVVLTLSGLIAVLMSDGWSDACAAAGLFVPAALTTWFDWRNRTRHR